MLSGLGAAVDRAFAVDVDALSDDELVDTVVDVHCQLARLQALQARLAGAVDARRVWAADGSKSPAAWLARATRCPKATAARAVRAGREQRHMPETAAAASDGDIHRHHVEELMRCRRVAPDAFADFEAQLVEYASTMRWDDFVRTVAYWCQIHDDDGAEERAEDAHRRRHLHLNERGDGTWDIYGRLDPIGGAAVAEAIRRREQILFRHDWAAAEHERGDDVRHSDLRRTSAAPTPWSSWSSTAKPRRPTRAARAR